MPEINPYESPQSENSTIPQARSAPEPPPYPSWVTRLIKLQMLVIVVTGICAVAFGSSTSADAAWRWVALGLSEEAWRWIVSCLFFLIELLAMILLRPAIKYRVYWLLISELSLVIPAACGLIVWLFGN